MGAGKTTVGACLARRVELDFVDLDAYIETREGLSIPDLFDQEGEAGFRRAESDALAALVIGPPIVLACGGGTPCDQGNMVRLESWGTVVFLHVDLETIASRLGSGTGRPLWGQDVVRLYDRRLSFYRRADVHVDAAGDVDSVVDLILRALERRYD